MITDYIIVTGCTERSETAMAPESRPAGMVPPLSPLKTETPSKPITQLRDAVLKQLKEGYTPHGSPYATGDTVLNEGKMFHLSAQAMIKTLAPAQQAQPSRR